MQAYIGQVQEELQEVYLEGRQHKTILENSVVSQGEEYAQMMWVEMKKNEQNFAATLGGLKMKIQTWVKEAIHQELSAV